jgi:hypothetical protein
MNAEEDDLYYCSKCDEGFSSINPTDEGQFCDSCLPSSATLHDEMERITMDAESFGAEDEEDLKEYHMVLNYGGMKPLKKVLEWYSDDFSRDEIIEEFRELALNPDLDKDYDQLQDVFLIDADDDEVKYAYSYVTNQFYKDGWDEVNAETFDEYSSLFEIKIPADSYDVGPDSQLRKWIRSMEQKGYSHILRRRYYTVVYDEEGNKFFPNTPEYLIFDIRDEHEITSAFMEIDLNSFDELMIYGSEKMERVFINYDRSPSLVKPAINPKAEYIPVMDYKAYDKTFD